MNSKRNEKKYSIIIPVYNAARFIVNTLDSLKQQTYKNIEIILVNDGSVDDTAAIIKEYIANNPSISIIYSYINNSGPSTARNIGFNKATGDYVCFLDSDDQYKETLFEDLSKLDYNPDICYFGWQEVNENGEICFKYENVFNYIAFNNGKEACLNKYNKNFWICNCNAIYRTEFLRANNISYLNGVYSGEDSNFIYKALFFAENIDYLEGDYFINNIRSQSLSHAPNMQRMLTEYNALSDLKQFFKTNQYDAFVKIVDSMVLIANLTIAKKIIKSGIGFNSFYKTIKEKLPVAKEGRELLLRKEKLENFLYQHCKLGFYLLVKVYYGLITK